jgi:tripartite-type tricarboxylate transporter receptor subunit TctC
MNFAQLVDNAAMATRLLLPWCAPAGGSPLVISCTNELADNLHEAAIEHGSCRMRLSKVTIAAIAIAICTLCFDGHASAQNAEAEFFHGKTVKIAVGFSPGGGYDIYARMLAPYLSKYLNTTVIVENKPGAGGIRALNALYVAPPDGLQMMLVKGTAATMAQITEQAGVRYDMSKLGYLGGTGASPDVWLTGPNAKVASVGDAVRQRSLLMWGATGPMDGLSDGAAITCEAFKLNCKIVLGYPGTNDVVIALARGESDFALSNESSASNYVRGKSAIALATMSRKRSRFFPDVPTIFESYNMTADQAWWFDFRSNVDVLGRVLLVPPGVADARMTYLREVVRKALTDPELIAEGEKSLRFVEYQDPEITQSTAIRIIRDMSPEQRARVKEVTSRIK